MSNRSRPNHDGPFRTFSRGNGRPVPYAIVIRSIADTLVAVNRPPGCGMMLTRLLPDLFGLTDATSNVGGRDWARGIRPALQATPTTNKARRAMLVRIRALDMVDHKNIGGRLRRLEFQAKLFTQRRKDRRI